MPEWQSNPGFRRLAPCLFIVVRDCLHAHRNGVAHGRYCATLFFRVQISREIGKEEAVLRFGGFAVDRGLTLRETLPKLLTQKCQL